jgi:hypothetical protein
VQHGPFAHGIVVGYDLDDARADCYTGCFFSFVLSVCRDDDGCRQESIAPQYRCFVGCSAAVTRVSSYLVLEDYADESIAISICVDCSFSSSLESVRCVCVLCSPVMQQCRVLTVRRWFWRWFLQVGRLAFQARLGVGCCYHDCLLSNNAGHCCCKVI